jgi:hypothetical protein
MPCSGPIGIEQALERLARQLSASTGWCMRDRTTLIAPEKIEVHRPSRV